METLAQNITRGLQDPLRPTVCAACLSILTFDYIDHTDKTDIRELRRNHHALWSAAIEFIRLSILFQEPARMIGPQLVYAMVTCRQAPTPAHGSYVHATRPQDVLPRKVVATLFHALRLCLHDSPVSSARFSRHGLWPTRPRDLVPSGDDHFSLMLFWLEQLPGDRSVVDVFNYMFVLCKDEALKYLLSPLQRIALFQGICTSLEEATELARTRAQACAAPQLDHIFALSDLLWTIFSALTTAGNAGPFAGLEERIIDAVQPALDVLPDCPQREHLATIGGQVIPLILRFMRAEPLHPYVLEVLSRSAEKVPDAFHSFHQLLRAVAQRRVCALPGCGRREHELGRALQLCGACRVFKYCSPECQKKHWKAQPFPHKATCSSLCALFQTAEARLAEEEFVARFEAADVDRREVARLFGIITTQMSSKNTPKHAEETAFRLLFQDGCVRSGDLTLQCTVNGVTHPLKLNELSMNAKYLAGFDK